MKIHFGKYFYLSTTSITLAYSTVLHILLNLTPASALENQQLTNEVFNNPAVLNGLYTDTYPNFFRDGKKRFEREIENIQQKRPESSENILEIDPYVQKIQEILAPLENPEFNPKPTQS